MKYLLPVMLFVFSSLAFAKHDFDIKVIKDLETDIFEVQVINHTDSIMVCKGNISAYTPDGLHTQETFNQVIQPLSQASQFYGLTTRLIGVAHSIRCLID